MTDVLIALLLAAGSLATIAWAATRARQGVDATTVVVDRLGRRQQVALALVRAESDRARAIRVPGRDDR